MFKSFLLLMLMFATPILAKSTTPSRCASDNELNELYTFDYLARMNALNGLWSAYGGCGRVDLFWNFAKLPVMDFRTSIPEEACGYSASFNATKDFLYNVRGECNISCYDKGFGFGELVGQYFCSIASAPDELKDCLPESGVDGVFCSARAQTTCNIGYDAKSTNVCEMAVVARPVLHMEVRENSCLLL